MPMINCPTCGAGLKVPEGMGGRKARCNKCQNVFTIPAGAAPPPAAAPMPAAPQMRMAPPVARAMPAAPMPRTGPPPVPAAPMPPALPAYAPAPPGYAPPPPGYAPGQAYADAAIATGPRRGPRPMSADGPGPRRRKKKGSPVLLWSLIGGGAFLLIGVVVLLMFLLWGGGGPGAELAYMPDDAEFIAQVQLGALRNSSAFKTLTKDDKTAETTMNQAKQNLGIEIDDITSIMFGGKKSSYSPIMAVRTKKGYTADQILDNLNWKANSSSAKEGNFTINKNNGTGMGFCVVNSSVVVFGHGDDLQKIFKRNGPPNLSSDMRSAMNSISYSSTLAFAAAGDIAKNAKSDFSLPGVDGGKMAAPLGAAGTINVSSTININGTVFFNDSTTAGNMADMAKGALAAAKNMAEMPKDMKNIVEKVQVSASGSRLVASVNGIDPEWLKSNKGMNLFAGMPNLGGPGPIVPGPIVPGPIVPGPINPVNNNTPVIPNSLVKRSGSFTDFNVNVKPNDRYTYEVQCKGGGQCVLNIKPQFDAIMNVQIKQGNNTIASDQGLRTNFVLQWHAAASSTYLIDIVSTDNLVNSCTVTFTDPGTPGAINPFPNPPPNPFPNPPLGGGTQKLNINGNVPPGGFQFHNVQLQAGLPCTIRCNSIGGFDPVIELINPNGQLVAVDDDGGGFPNSKIATTPNVAGNWQIKVRGFGNSGGSYNLTVQQ